jgi:uncharacterized phage protein (TIGR02216 family)
MRPRDRRQGRAAHDGAGGNEKDAAAFPFTRLFVLAVLLLRLSPSEFWRLTPRELFALLKAVEPPAPPDRETLQDLIRRFGG